MALIECVECGNSMSDLAESCPKCGWSLTPRPVRGSVGSIFKPGSFLRETRRQHLAGVAAFGGIGFMAMMKVEFLTTAGSLLGATCGLYLFALIVSRAIHLRDTPPSDQRQACFDVLDIGVFALLISFIGGFWWGFSLQVLDGGREVKELYLLWSSSFGVLSTGAFLISLAMSAACRVGAKG